ncbi:MAG: methionine--tRNA ligase [Oscillospiraceae bacterium]|nr:methionine--tRNA ligase [Oscillospiraceae bacterium]
MNKFYITSSILYASQRPHIGNVYEIIMCDAIARFRRLIGQEVHFLTGTDEHGQKVEDNATAKGVSPQAYVDEIVADMRGIWELLGISYDDFIRTTEPRHKDSVQKIFARLLAQDDIYKGEYSGPYCTPCESFFTDSQLKDGNCPDCGREVKTVNETAYFFRMSKYADRLIQHFNDNPEWLQPESRRNEMMNNFLLPGLQDLCVSRSTIKWGIGVPSDPESVVYVWIDALSNYITALGYDPTLAEQPELFQNFWPADVHMIGKDIVRFHSIYWPIFLMALDVPLPKKIFGHPWFLFNDSKLSKSTGNVLYTHDLVEHFGVDGTRHAVLAEMHYANDSNLSIKSVAGRYNLDLANNLGNLVSRTSAMTAKYFEGSVPAAGEATELDKELAEFALSAVAATRTAVEEYSIADALAETFALLRRANKYIDETEPWNLAKEGDTARLGTVIYNLLECIRIGAVVLQAFIPTSATEILDRLGCTPLERTWESIQGFGGLAVGRAVTQGTPLFARIDEEKLPQPAEKTAPSPVGAGSTRPPANNVDTTEPTHEIDITAFAAVDLRCALVLECEPVPKSDKLLKLQVDLGGEVRQVVSGIAEFYAPADLVGKKVILVANLKPAKIRGVESRGMILAADGVEGVSVVFLDDSVPAGEKVR